MTVELAVTVGRVQLSNPVLVASGTFGFGEEYAEAFPLARLGAVITKSVTLSPREGNVPPRLWETPAGLLNSIGLANPGVDRACAYDIPQLLGRGATVVVSIAGDQPTEYGQLAQRLQDVEGIAALEVNVSCPNVARGGLLIGCDPQAVKAAVSGVRQVTDLPVWVKLTPNVTDIVEIARAALEAGADAVVLINTVRGMAIDLTRMKPALGAGGGGLSGPAIKPIAVRVVYDVYQALGCDIVGCGGVASVDDALEFMAAGARAVTVGTALFADPTTPWAIVDQLPGRCRTLDVESTAQVVGMAHRREDWR